MRQLSLWPAPASGAVWMSCPACEATWHGASIHPGAWWAVGVTPQSCVAAVYCPACGQRPPMRVADAVALKETA